MKAYITAQFDFVEIEKKTQELESIFLANNFKIIAKSPAVKVTPTDLVQLKHNFALAYVLETTLTPLQLFIFLNQLKSKAENKELKNLNWLLLNLIYADDIIFNLPTFKLPNPVRLTDPIHLNLLCKIEAEKLDPENKTSIKTLAEKVSKKYVLEYLETRADFNMGLKRMNYFLKNLEFLNQIPYIHVVGTNGKGSTSLYISKALERNGYKVGLFQSPYVKSLTDSISISGKEITFSEIYLILNVLMHLINISDHNGVEISRFELEYLITLIYFAKNKIDFAVVEAGLGGRDDATNATKNKLATVITRVDLDHTKFLGKNRRVILEHKADAIRENGLAVALPLGKALENYLHEKCKERNAKLEIVNLKEINKANVGINVCSYEYGGRLVKLEARGRVQIQNSFLALNVLKHLNDREVIKTDFDKNVDAVCETKYQGRYEFIKENVMIDGAHNVNAFKELSQFIRDTLPQGSTVLLLMSCMKDKNYNKMVEEIVKIKNLTVVTTEVTIKPDRSLTSVELAKEFIAQGVRPLGVVSIKDFLVKLEVFAKKYDLVLIAGSLYMITELKLILEDLKEKSKKE